MILEVIIWTIVEKKEIKELEVNDKLTDEELEEIAKDEFLSECNYEWKIYKKR